MKQPVRRPWRSSSAAIIRVVDDLPLVPTMWIVGNGIVERSRTFSSRRIRSSPKRIPKCSRAEQEALGLVGGPGCAGLDLAIVHWASSSSSSARSFWRSRSTTSGGALATNAALPSLPCARAISARRTSRRFSARPACASGSMPSRIAITPPGIATLACGSPPFDAAVAELEPRRARNQRRDLVVAVGLDPRDHVRARSHADRVAPATNRLRRRDHAVDRALSLRVEQRRRQRGRA